MRSPGSTLWSAFLLTGIVPLFVVGADNPAAWVAPTEETARTNPVPFSTEALRKGKALYQRNCATCHGDKGKGDGPSARNHAKKALPPQDLTDPAVQARLADGEIFWKIGEGLKRDGQIIMPAFEQEIGSAENRWKVVLFVRSLDNTGGH